MFEINRVRPRAPPWRDISVNASRPTRVLVQSVIRIVATTMLVLKVLVIASRGTAREV